MTAHTPDPRPDPATFDPSVFEDMTGAEVAAYLKQMRERAIDEDLLKYGPLLPGDISVTKGRDDVPMSIASAWHDFSQDAVAAYARVVDSRLHATNLPPDHPRSTHLQTAPLLHRTLTSPPPTIPVLSQMSAPTPCGTGPIPAVGRAALVLIPLEPPATERGSTTTTAPAHTLWLHLLTVTFADARPDLIVLEQVAPPTAERPHQYQVSVLNALASRTIDQLHAPPGRQWPRPARRPHGPWDLIALPDPPSDPLPAPAPDLQERTRDEDSR